MGKGALPLNTRKAIDKGMKNWSIPDLAVSIVKDDCLVFTKGYGLRDIRYGTPVDEQTFFAIGSITNSFTAALLAFLVDEGKLSWDDPVTKYLPSFHLFGPWAPRELTVRDLLAHRTGLAHGDFLW
jgi:CubicO group peptidase (beta-lactamase class C family)